MRLSTHIRNHRFHQFILHVLLGVKCLATTSSIVPLQVEFSTEFLGDDGQWSVAQFRVGTSPQQWLQTIPSTLSSETWVVGPGGCDNTLTCASRRGGLFYWNQSATWDELGYFDLGYNELSQTTLGGQYGLDNISFTNTVSIGRQSVAIVNDTSIWIGELGLGIRDLIYTDNVLHPSFLATLGQNKTHIPSTSYGYTAGAYYAAKGIYGSLTLGGVDTTRFITNDFRFSLSNTYAPVVAIRSIAVTSAITTNTSRPANWNTDSVALLTDSEAIYANIDSSTPFLWLPQSVCDQFASALNLTYSEDLGVYLYSNSSSPQILSNWNLTFTFTLSNSQSSTNTVDLPVSFNAFNLQLSYPYTARINATSNSNPINYFPLRRATTSSQYTIGRAFLQETYLTVDYESSSFYISQALYPDLNVVSPQLVSISAGSDGGSRGGFLSTGAKAGIGIGVCLGVLTLASLVYWVLRRRRSSNSGVNDEKGGLMAKLNRQQKPKTPVMELLGDKQHPREIHADKSNTRFELDADALVEMPAGEVSSEYFEATQSTRAAAVARNDPSRPAELGQQGVMSKELLARMEAASDRSHSPVPAYSLLDTGSDRRPGDSVSPNSIPHSNPFGGSQSSGEQGISPIAQFMNSHHRFSQEINSPVSPSFSGSNGGTRHDVASQVQVYPQNSTRNSHLAPEDAVVARTTSRSSRFREELTEKPAETPGAEQIASAQRRRFSWEEGTTM